MGTDAGRERRVHPRWKLESRVALKRFEHGATVAVTRNISRSGVLLWTQSSLRPGERLVLTFQPPGSLDEGATVVGTVIRRIQVSGSAEAPVFSTAVRFAELLDGRDALGLVRAKSSRPRVSTPPSTSRA